MCPLQCVDYGKQEGMLGIVDRQLDLVGCQSVPTFRCKRHRPLAVCDADKQWSQWSKRRREHPQIADASGGSDARSHM